MTKEFKTTIIKTDKTEYISKVMFWIEQKIYKRENTDNYLRLKLDTDVKTDIFLVNYKK